MQLFKYLAALAAPIIVAIYNYFYTHGYVLVEIDKGILRGRNTSTWGGTNYFSFKGIPYAKPPIGDLSFKAPQEETAWDGIRDALSHGEVCPQFDMAFDQFWGQEDCLFLNVYTPSLENKRLPVMFWIYGGAFNQGFGDEILYSPDYLVDAGVILVTFNHRVGALGFLSTEDDRAPGNAGLKDQVAALRWIRRNIAKFGGDPENVTIFGGSSGASCIHLHLLSPMSKGLFSKAIAQSGSALNAYLIPENGAEIMFRLAEAMGAKNVAGDTSGALEFLKTAPYKDIIRAQVMLMTGSLKKLRTDLLFVASIETGVKSEEVFLPDTPLKILESGNFSKVPFITGYNDQEAYFFANDLEQPECMKRACEETGHHLKKLVKNEEMRENLSKLICKFYFEDKPIGYENISNLVDFYSDIVFVAGVRRATKLHLEVTNSSTYFYVFTYDGGLNLMKFLFDLDRPGAIHGDELGYLFYQKAAFWRRPVTDSEDDHMIKTMTRLWTNFAKFGNPTPPGDPLNWKPATIERFNYLNISGLDSNLGENPHPKRNAFWEKFYEILSAPRSNFCDPQDNSQFEKWTGIHHNDVSDEQSTCNPGMRTLPNYANEQ